jgi:hypothetical protein
VDERDVHAAHEAHAVAAADERRERADEEGALLLAELERGEVGRRRHDVPRGVGLQCVVDARERRAGVLARERREVVGEDEAHADDQVHPLGGEQAKAGLAVGALAGLDEAHAGAELALRALGAEVGAVVEGLVAAAADVEDDADVERIPLRRLRRPGRPHEEEGDVRREEHADHEEQLSHGRSFTGWMGAGKEAARPARPQRCTVPSFQRPFSMSDA